MLSLFAKIRNHFQRLANARYFRVPFFRRKSFQLPHGVRIGKKMVPLAYPLEPGTIQDFLTCFIDDEYGLGKIGEPIETIVDIGANTGFFSMAARARFPAAKIHAYEPNPRILHYLHQNAEAAGFQVYPEALGNHEGVVSIVDDNDSNLARTTIAEHDGAKIPQVLLAKLIDRLGGRVDLAKIDCEGAEWAMFETREPWHKIKLLRMEYHLCQSHLFTELEKILAILGFDIVLHRSSGDWGTVWARNRNLSS